MGKNKSFHKGRKKINFWLLQISLRLTGCSLFCKKKGSAGWTTERNITGQPQHGFPRIIFLGCITKKKKRKRKTHSVDLKQMNRTRCPITCIWDCRIYSLIDGGDISNRAKTYTGVTYLQVSRRRGRDRKRNANDYLRGKRVLRSAQNHLGS